MQAFWVLGYQVVLHDFLWHEAVPQCLTAWYLKNGWASIIDVYIFFHHECESMTLPWQRHLASEGQQQKPLKFWLFSIHVYLVSSAFKPLFNRKVKGGNICQHFPITHFHTPYKKESSLYQNNMKQFDHILRQTRCSRLVASETVKTPEWLTQGPV